jgi:hypothetical protein
MHTIVAEWLESYATDRLDEFVELIAYHYREAILLQRRWAVPSPAAFEVDRAVYFLERAGEFFSRSGGFAVGRAHLQSAIDIAPEDQHTRLYEQLGDCAGWGDAAQTAYEEALRRWRDKGSADPAVGARLLRKILIIHMRWSDTAARPTYDEMVQMREAAHRLAEESGDEDELWRVRIADLFWPSWRRLVEGIDPSPEDAEDGARSALAAAAHFERRGDWAALDGYAAGAELAGKYDEMVEATRRRLAAPELSAIERGDALVVLVRGYQHLGAYQRTVSRVLEELAGVRPGDPTAHLAHAAIRAAQAAWLSGSWSDMASFLAVIEDAALQQPHSRIWQLGYWPAFWLSAAREDPPAVNARAAALARLMEHEGEDERAVARAWIRATIEDAPSLLDLELVHKVYAGDTEMLTHLLSFLSEHRVKVPGWLLAHVTNQARAQKNRRAAKVVQVAEAVVEDDAKQLAFAIDEVERHGLIPHAARMRIVLAQVGGDPAPVRQARPVLERLEDRRFLRRLQALEQPSG